MPRLEPVRLPDVDVAPARLQRRRPGDDVDITDDLADEAHNLDLSIRRAQAVAEWFTANAGLDPARIVVTGLGETTPAYPNDSDEHRQLNRRVVISL